MSDEINETISPAEDIEKKEESTVVTETEEQAVPESVTADENNITEKTETENSTENTDSTIENKTETEVNVEIDSKDNLKDESKEVKKTKKEKAPKEKKERKPIHIRASISEGYDKIQASIPLLGFTCLAAVLVMAFAAFAIFFNNAKGAEKVLVPNVIGKSLEDALLELQVKELYPKINLRYSETPGDEGTILDQSPSAGAIVKGYSRVSLVVSRGVVVDKVEEYVGMNIDEVQMRLQTLFAGQTRPLIVLATPEYKPDLSNAGTVLEQDPPAGTSISEPVTVQLIVSRGPNYENTKAPWVMGQSVNDLLQTIARSKIVFDISGHIAEEGEKAGTVVNQQRFDSEYVPNYTRVTVEMALPEELNDNVYGIFTEKLAEYPYPVPMKLEAVPDEGDAYTILSFSHPGGNLTIPYAVPRGTTLVLTVVDKVTSRKTVN